LHKRRSHFVPILFLFQIRLPAVSAPGGVI
jgi:hypothetical protein